MSLTIGILVEPPTNNTVSNSSLAMPESLLQALQGSTVFSSIGPTNCSNLDLERGMFKCFGPVMSAVMNGKFICLHLAGKLNLCRLSCFPQPLYSQLVLRQIDALRLFELLDK